MADVKINEQANLIWSIADRGLRNNFKKWQYAHYIVPPVIPKRFDSVLEETFKSMYRGEMPKIITKRHLDNDAIFQTILSNEELYNRVIEEVLSSVYRQCREDLSEDDEEC